jgi:hypothetical protein
MKSITIHTRDDAFTFEADNVSENDGNFLTIFRKENPRLKSYTEGSLWWKKVKTYTDYDYNPIAMFRVKDVLRVSFGEKK